MRHKSIRKKLLRYLDKELSEKESRRVLSHLESCQSCQSDLKAIESLWRINRPVERMATPPFLWAHISAQLKAEEKQGFFDNIKDAVLPLLRPAILVGTLLLALIGGMKLGDKIAPPPVEQAEIQIETKDNLGMSYFEVLPPGSIDARVLALTESEM